MSGVHGAEPRHHNSASSPTVSALSLSARPSGYGLSSYSISGVTGATVKSTIFASRLAEFPPVPYQTRLPQARSFQGGVYEVRFSPVRIARNRSRAKSFCRTSGLPGRRRTRRRNDQGNREVAGTLGALGAIRTQPQTASLRSAAAEASRP